MLCVDFCIIKAYDNLVADRILCLSALEGSLTVLRKMKSLLILFVILGTTVAASIPRSSWINKIIGGYIVEKGAHKYQVHIGVERDRKGIYEPMRWDCGGSIISSKWILTAAHCLENLDESIVLPHSVLVRTGQHDRTVLEDHARNYKVLHVIAHAQYRFGGRYNNDIALLELADEIQFNDYTSPVALPADGSAPIDGSELFVSGWGRTETGFTSQLRAVAVNAVNKDTCNAQYSGTIVPGMLCAAGTGKDSCQGDSGGPLVQQDAYGTTTLVGVVSFGYGCAVPSYAGVYADVGYYMPWIKLHLGVL